jgi:hypothetical protein
VVKALAGRNVDSQIDARRCKLRQGLAMPDNVAPDGACELKHVSGQKISEAVNLKFTIRGFAVSNAA